MFDFILKAGKLIALLLIVYLLFLVIFQRKVIYYPSMYPDKILSSIQMSRVTEIPYNLNNQKQVAFYLPPQSAGDPSCLWVVFGGNGALALGWLNLVLQYPDPDAAFLLVDYPGYGVNEGSPTLSHNMDASRAAYDAFLNIVPYKPKALGVLGHSLGSAVAVQFAETYKADNLLLLSPFTSMQDMVRVIFPVVGHPLSFLLLDKYDVQKVLARLLANNKQMDIMIMHGALDEIVPVTMSRNMAQEFSGYVKYEEIATADHNFIDNHRHIVIAGMQNLCAEQPSHT